MTTPAQHDDKSYVGFQIADAARLMRTVFDRRVRAMGLTRSQWRVIRGIFRNPGISQSELADILEVEKATAGRLLDRLEKKDWIERRPDAADRRINRLFLTRRAVRLNAKIQPVAEDMVEEALQDLSPAERETLAKIISTMKVRLQDMAEHMEDEDLPAKSRRQREKPEEVADRALDLA